MRINVRLPQASHRELELRARRRGTTIATLVREAVDRYLGQHQTGQTLALGDDTADRLIGMFEGSAGDESVDHDRYLYGWRTDH